MARELRIKVTVDSTNARRNLRGVDTQTKAIGTTAAAAGVSMGGMITRALGAVAVVDVLRRIGSTAINMNRQIEDAELRFQALGLSSEDAARHVADLFQFAQRTPFETTPIIEASAQLANFGGEALNTRDNLEALGNAAAGSQSPIERVAHWAGRMFSTLESGKIAIGESTAALLEMGAINGETRITLEKLAASGASADEVFQALIDSTEKFGPALENAQNSVGGLTSSIADNFGQLLGKLGDITGAFSLFKTGLEITNAQYSNFNETLTGAVDVFGLAREAVTGNVEAWADLKLAVTTTSDEFNEARRDAGRLEDRIEDLSRAIGTTGPRALGTEAMSATDALALADEAMQALEDDTERLAEEAKAAADAEREAREATDEWRASVTSLTEAFQGHSLWIADWDLRLQNLGERSREVNELIDLTTAKVTLQSKAIEGLDDMMTQRIQPTLNKQKGIMESFKDDALGSFGEFFSEVKDNWGDLFSAEGLGAITTNGLGLVQNILATALGPLGPLVGIFLQFGSKILEFFGGLFSKIGSAISSFFGGVVGLIGSIPGFGGGQPAAGRFGIPADHTGFPTHNQPSDEGTILVGAQTGGLVTGGTSAVDGLLARISSGEFVMRREAVARIGAANLAAANAGGGLGGGLTINISLPHAVISDDRALNRLTDQISRRIVRQVRSLKAFETLA